MKIPAKEAKYTSIPEYYFDCLDMIHYGLVPIIDHSNAIKRACNELETKKEQAKSEPFLCKNVIQ